ncbi:MAG TPA: response regulator transcription factor [Candidatus Dojkabacteria bacterium]|nr:response regulator transcription factor [Candidatus Dojkabacteria bacterium]HRP51121.1 response regulator transcription factor [Candidatus Dojkabacteria bacterium]
MGGTSMRLLLIEDEEDLARPLIKALSDYGFAVDYSNEGTSGLSKAEINQYDCILLDLNLPGIDGISISNKLRAQNINTPILMVTAKHQIDDKLIGFEAGADDYISKPFNLKELTARIKAIVRRSSENKTHNLEFLNYELIPDKNTLLDTQTGEEIELTTKECSMLEYMIRNINRTIPAEELLEHVWDEEANPFSDTIKTHIKTLRKKFDPQKKILKTIHGKGYMLNTKK